MRKKDRISIIYITILTVIALVYGFMTIPSPAEQRKIVEDHRRVSDLGAIKQNIEDYYTAHKTLPQSLEEVKPISLKDPETNAQYEYRILYEVPPYIQLCANFTTDSAKDNPYETDSSNYTYQSYSGNFPHPKGHYCFKLNINYYSPTPTETPTSITPAVPKRPFSDYPPKK